MLLKVGCQFTYEVEAPTAVVVQVEPRVEHRPSILREEWVTTPELPLHPYRDMFGNSCQRTLLPVGHVALGYDATVDVLRTAEDVDLDAPEHAPEDLPDETLVFTLPSRFCLPNVLGDVAWREFGSLPTGYRRVQAICDFVHDHLAFRYGSSTPITSALDAYQAKEGVCRDYVHLAISFCRALNIPARYVFGYLPDIDVPPPYPPMDFAAWMEVYLGNRWWTFDPRNNERRIGRVLIGRGRDAADVAMITTFGGPRLADMTVWAETEGADAEPAESGIR